jgi:hypothetical protein
MMSGLEALFDAMSWEEGHQPHDRSKRNRNPLNLRGSHYSHTVDDGGYCVFGSIVDGVAAGLADLQEKCDGRNAHGLGPASTLQELIDVFAPRSDRNNPSAYALAVAAWCTRALERPVHPATTLGQLTGIVRCPPLPAAR